MQIRSIAVLGAVMGLSVALGHHAGDGHKVITGDNASAQLAPAKAGADRLHAAGTGAFQLAAGEGGADRLGAGTNSSS
jgi:hypothetical protein